MRNSSVGTAADYRLDAEGSVPAGVRDFALRHTVPIGSGGHKATYSMGSKGSFPGGKAAEA
jgi:hypothetical protein